MTLNYNSPSGNDIESYWLEKWRKEDEIKLKSVNELYQHLTVTFEGVTPTEKQLRKVVANWFMTSPQNALRWNDSDIAYMVGEQWLGQERGVKDE